MADSYGRGERGKGPSYDIGASWFLLSWGFFDLFVFLLFFFLGGGVVSGFFFFFGGRGLGCLVIFVGVGGGFLGGVGGGFVG